MKRLGTRARVREHVMKRVWERLVPRVVVRVVVRVVERVEERIEGQMPPHGLLYRHAEIPESPAARIGNTPEAARAAAPRRASQAS